MLKNPYKTLVEAASLAPSGDNVQPWLFRVAPAEQEIIVELDETRDQSPMNAGQRMSRIACGAAVENIVQTADYNGWPVSVDIAEDGTKATVNITDYAANVDDATGVIPEVIQARHANRRKYDGRQLSVEDVDRLESCDLSEQGVNVEWITGRENMRAVSRDIARADAKMFGQPEFLRAFLENVRFDLPANAVAKEGLSVGSLEVSAFESWLMPRLSNMPGWLLNLPVLKQPFYSHAIKLLNSSSGVVLIETSSLKHWEWDVGRVMQRVWLRLTELGYQVQPMMTIPALLNTSRRGMSRPPQLGVATQSTAAVLRFGVSQPATARVGRMERIACEERAEAVVLA